MAAEVPTLSNLEAQSSASVKVMPLDISKKSEEKITQNLRGQSFPKRSDGRSFQPNWIEKFNWIEYSKQTDKVYCYPCRQFGIGNATDMFISSGYNGWKRALSAGQGFQKHESSTFHINSMLSWKEHASRINKNQQISNLLNETLLEKRRYYFKAIIGTILFLVKNELPLRGDKARSLVYSTISSSTLSRKINISSIAMKLCPRTHCIPHHKYRMKLFIS